MSVTSYLLFFFSSLGVFNGLILATWLLIRRKQQVGDTWLAVLLLLLSVRIGKSIAFYFTPSLDKNILQLGLTACFLIGPCIVAYIAYQRNDAFFQLMSKWVFICSAIIIVIVGIVYPYNDYLELWQYWVYRGSSYIWLTCLLVSFYLYQVKLKRLEMKWRSFLTDKNVIVLIGSTLIWLAYYTASYTSYIMGALSFSLVLYLSVLLLLRTRQVSDNNIDKYANSKLTMQQVAQYSCALDEMIENEQVFIDAQLTLPRLAKRIGVPHTVLSQLLNDHYKMNFKQFINSHRIALAQKLLIAQPKASIDDIAEQSGFSASSTFYNAFKQQTGMTPKHFRTTKL